MLMLVGQVSGILFVLGMDLAAGSNKTPAMILFLVLVAINIVLNMRLRESKFVQTDNV